MKRISYSQLTLWQNCPKQWKLKYIDKLVEFKPSIHLLFGSAMHTVLQEYLTTMYTQTVKAADTLPLESRLQEEMIKEFMSTKEKHDRVPCTKEELQEFFQDGVDIINFFVKRRGEYFSKKGWQLKGIEVPINIKLSESVRFIGFLDVVMYHEPTNTYKIIDIKTSTMGWNKWMKADKTKTSQLLLYKRFLAEQWKVSVEQIDVEYFIVKRRLYEKADFPQKRVQKFVPANGSVSMNRASNGLAEFIAKSFTDDGQFITEQPATPSKKACKWCEFRKTEHCSVGV